MGYSTRGGEIRDFWPDDTADVMYISSGMSFAYIMQRIMDKWPSADLEDISMDAEHIHTSCLTYDCYDRGDYTNFIVITRIK